MYVCLYIEDICLYDIYVYIYYDICVYVCMHVCMYCKSAVLNHFAIKTLCTLRNNNWIQLLFHKVQSDLIAKW
jgi:hypothetical protein